MCDTIPAPLAGKSAIITGGSRGIGAGIAVELARKGCIAIAITFSTRKSSADAVLKSIEAISPSIRTVAIQADLFSPDFGHAVTKSALEALQLSTIDIVISNAALTDPKYVLPMHLNTKENFDWMMTANTWAPFDLAMAALPHLSRGGRIINISSIVSRGPNCDPTVIYGASKAALDAITRGLAVMYAKEKGITVNSVAVGYIRTDTLKAAFEVLPSGAEDEVKRNITAADRIGEVEDVAGIVAFLCSDEARWINGNYVPANGGALLALQG